MATINDLEEDWKKIVHDALELESADSLDAFQKYGRIYRGYLLMLLHEQKREEHLKAVYDMVNLGIVEERTNSNGKFYYVFNHKWSAE